MELNKITSYKQYPSNVEIFFNGGWVSINLNYGTDWGDATWTDEEAEKDAREILREHGLDDASANNFLISLIAEQFPRA